MVADGWGALPGNLLLRPAKRLKPPKSLKSAKNSGRAALRRARAPGSCQ
jgi:hypothetical protein